MASVWSCCSLTADEFLPFTTIVRPDPLRTPPYMQQPLRTPPYMQQETLMRVRSVRKLAFLSVTDIQTYRRKTRSEAGLALRRSEIISDCGEHNIRE